jgi:hypothetical protein
MKILISLILLTVLLFNFYRVSKIDKILSLENEIDIIIGIDDLLWAKSKNTENLELLNEYEKYVIFINMLDAQVNNGGFDQYFFNSSGENAHETLIALEKINAPKTAKLLTDAISVFPKLPIPKDTNVRRKLMDNLSDKISNTWDELDNQFYKSQEHIGGLVINYVRENKNHF